MSRPTACGYGPQGPALREGIHHASSRARRTGGTLLVVAFAPAAAGAVHRRRDGARRGQPVGLRPRLRADHRRGAERPGARWRRRPRPARPASATPTSRSRATAASTSGTTTSTFSYDPATDRLDAVNQIRARGARRTLSRFDLDLQQLDVSAVTVNGKPATFTRDGQELQITPEEGCRQGRTSTSASATAACRRRSSARRSCSARPTASCTPTTAPSWATSPTRRRRGSR